MFENALVQPRVHAMLMRVFCSLPSAVCARSSTHLDAMLA